MEYNKRNPHGVMAKVLEYNFEATEFGLQLVLLRSLSG